MKPSSAFPCRLLWATTLGLSLHLGACSDPPKPVVPKPMVPAPPPVDNSSWVQHQEASRLEAEARGLPPPKTEEALRLAYRALEIRRRLLGDAHQDTWRTAELIAHLHMQANQLDQAETALQFDLAARERTFGSASAELARPLAMLADLAVKRRNHTGAEQLHRRVLSVLEAGLGPWHPDVATGQIRLATLLLQMCRGSEAEPLLQRALEIQGRVFGATSPDLAGTWRHLAEAYGIAGNQAGEESSLQKAIALLSPYEKDRAEALMEALDRLATMYPARFLPEEARATRERAVDIGGRFLGASNYNNGLAVNPNLTGTIRVTARVASLGEVSHVSAFVQAGTMVQVGECVFDVVMQSQFAPPEGGGATIIIPVTFMTQ